MRKQIPDFEDELEEELEEEQTEEGLPPRSEIHRNKEKKKSKFKINHFFVRVLTFLFILLPLSILWYTDKYIEVKSANKNDTSGKNAFEVIFFDSNKHGEGEKKQLEKFETHIVKEGETFESIGKQYFPNEDGATIIKNYNNLQDDQLEVGKELKIPIKEKIEKE
ncbi:LysM peptidoglycan-binding domain-containing protein [Bacillus sp. Xin]|uniref:LysM peptidoglycan-binding domain-containing protein n=1 Tax=unclassified Bacillus (in: firmicutes) TaxID=185979 RepID=UPI00157346B3|nr:MULTISPECIES: LysM peptidoglycan-binding domain-containing protein [unclassified Bacillus (in: firmicutes)]MBC6975584.1 LysM peptidoglycan-binding domain-containing protein [Bacillus sp. Xin]NSW35413.1 LysM peptidoglycan-binding domain-containing protein [Bacillus sp. Xin1]